MLGFEAWENRLFDEYNGEASQTAEDFWADVYDEMKEENMSGIVAERRLDEMPMDKVFYTANSRQELCHATCIAVQFAGDASWWNEYEDSEGNLYYGR